MISTHTLPDGSLWIDATAPTHREMQGVIDQYHIEVPINVLLDYAMQPSIKHHHNAVHTILRFPRKFADIHNIANTSFEIDLICSGNTLLTIHDVPLFEVDAVKKSLSVAPDHMSNHYDVGFAVIHECYNTVRASLIQISNDVEQLQLSVFDQYNRQSIMDITRVIRSIINIERSLRPHTAVIERFEALYTDMPDSAVHYRDRIIDLSREILAQLTTNRDILIEMRWIHGALLTHQTNKILILFTMVSFVALPLTIITDVFGLVHSDSFVDFRGPMLIGVTIIMGLIIYYFHRNSWL